LGVVIRGQHHSPEQLRGARYAILADAPCPTTPFRHSINHNGRGQNVMFADLHVQFLPTCTPKGCNDHIFVNDQGEAEPGLHEGDSVIGASDDAPLVEPMTIGVPAR
jgi:prepilin-type processing-associated H-X9-DG protein